MSKYIITGATGFIGSRLTKRLISNGHDVFIISRKTSNYKELNDIKDKLTIFEYDGNIDRLIEFYKKIKPDFTIHLASVYITEHSQYDVDDLIDSNIKFSTQILEAMNISGSKKIINTSTSWQHYSDEDYNPVNLYAATKEAFEDIIKFYINALDFSCISLELFDTYGENDSRNKILNILCKYSVEKTTLNMSKGNQIIDLTYIDDVIEAYICAIDILEREDNTLYKKYVVSSDRISLKELVKLYQDKTGYIVSVNWGAKEYRQREVMIPWTKGENIPTWQAKISLEEGIVKAFKNNKGEVND